MDFAPDRVVLQSFWPYGMAPIWFREPPKISLKPRLLSHFPPGWNELCGAYFAWYGGQNKPATVWNSGNPIVNLASDSAWDWCRENFNRSIDPVPYRAELLGDPGKAAAWLLLCIQANNYEIWGGSVIEILNFFPHCSNTFRNGGKHFEKAGLSSGFKIQTPACGRSLKHNGKPLKNAIGCPRSRPFRMIG